jgi:hypothetical protein
VQIIDDAANCTFSIFQFTDEQFSLIFSDEGQDIAFIDDVLSKLSESDQKRAFEDAWNRPTDKQTIDGLHGTLFYGFEDRQKHFPATRRECDWDDSAVNQAQRAMNASKRQRFEP